MFRGDKEWWKGGDEETKPEGFCPAWNAAEYCGSSNASLIGKSNILC